MSQGFAPYDQRHYTTFDVAEGYALWSKSYDAQVQSQVDIPLLEKVRAVEWAETRTVVDLACGSGRMGQWLASQRGVTALDAVDGVDLSPEMLALARAKAIYRSLVQAELCATTLAGPYDGALCALASCHLPELPPLYREAARLVRTGGCFILSDFHQHFLLNGIPTHFQRENGEPAAIRNYVHLMSDHFNAGLAAGWRLVEMHERLIDAAWVAAEPRMARHEHKPVGFLLVWRKFE